MNNINKTGFIGLGLIGGSLAKAIRRYYPACTIVAFDSDKAALLLAEKESVINVACSRIDDNFASCDYIFLCAPVSHNICCLKEIKKYMHGGCVLTDVGSVKGSIHKACASLGLDEYFIGGHPMAGSEQSGYKNSKALLLENAYYVLTPSEKVSKEKVDMYATFIESLRAIPIVLSYEEHDYVTAAISHLPHIMASALVNLVKEKDGENGHMKLLAAGGFKDITRIASSSPVMWQHICLENRENILKILDEYIAMLRKAGEAIARGSGDYVHDFFESSRDYRNSIPGNARGSFEKIYVLYCDIVDETGGIAAISTLLATNNINLKNIGILNNREAGEAVLSIEFAGETALNKASDLLRARGYTVYVR